MYNNAIYVLSIFYLVWFGHRTGDTRKAVDRAVTDVDAKKVLMKAIERHLEEGCEKLTADEEGKARARRTTGDERAAAEAKLEISSARLRQCQVNCCC